MIVRVEHVLFDLLTRAKPSTRAQSTFNSFLLEYSPACERTTLSTERIGVGEDDDDVFSLGVMPAPLWLAPLGHGSFGFLSSPFPLSLCCCVQQVFFSCDMPWVFIWFSLIIIS